LIHQQIDQISDFLQLIFEADFVYLIPCLKKSEGVAGFFADFAGYLQNELIAFHEKNSHFDVPFADSCGTTWSDHY
jgi:hypothetical protein